MEAALQYNDSYVEGVYSFANNIDTHEGGTHLALGSYYQGAHDYGRKYNYIKQMSQTFREMIPEALRLSCLKLMEPIRRSKPNKTRETVK